jgi:hypothetical protein
MPAGELFKDLPKTEAEEEEPKVNPFANTELDD